LNFGLGDAGSADLDAVAGLGRVGLASAWTRAQLDEALAARGTLLVVAHEDGVLVGYALGRSIAGELEVHQVVVAASHRRRGFGSRLLDALLERAGARVVHLEVRADDAGVRRFYRERRFREIGRRPRYYPGGEDAILMSRNLGPLRADGDVVANEPDGATGRRLRLRVPGWPGADPGQFVMLSPGPRAAAPRTDPLLPRPMAVYRSLPDEQIEILYKISGRGTALLAAAASGDRIGVVGPLGRGFDAPVPGERALLVGGGTGTASLLEQAAAAAKVGSATVMLGARTAGELLGVAEFEAMPVGLELATEDGSRGHHGLVTEPLAKALAADSGAVVYACGPTPMMRAAATLAREHGARCLVSLENPMACGFGVCLGCAAPLAGGGVALVCRDGPVMDAAAVDWENLA
jgi:dihydroorotate dehydrogenase electron transfer subunit